MKLEATVRAFALVLAILLILATGALSAGAQTAATGAITGTVKDATGAVVVGATVTAMLRGRGETRQADSNAEGVYRVPLLPPGEYSISVEKQGFKTSVHSGVKVTVAETQAVDLQLQVGSMTETSTSWRSQRLCRRNRARWDEWRTSATC